VHSIKIGQGQLVLPFRYLGHKKTVSGSVYCADLANVVAKKRVMGLSSNPITRSLQGP